MSQTVWEVGVSMEQYRQRFGKPVPTWAYRQSPQELSSKIEQALKSGVPVKEWDRYAPIPGNFEDHPLSVHGKTRWSGSHKKLTPDQHTVAREQCDKRPSETKQGRARQVTAPRRTGYVILTGTPRVNIWTWLEWRLHLLRMRLRRWLGGLSG